MHKWLMFGLFCMACVLATGLLLYGLPHKEEASPEPAAIVVPDQPIDADAAQALYKSSCLSCHGDQLQGRIGPKLDHVGDTLSQEQIYKQIVNGGGGMPKFEGRLSEDEVVTLTNWLASLKS